MSRPDPSKAVERGRELAPLRQKAFQELEQNPALTPKKLSEMLEVNPTTAATWKARWKKKKEKREKREAQPVQTKEITPEAVADALLSRVVAALTENEKLSALLSEYKSQVSHLEKELDIEKQEKERILKIHNEQVKGRSLTDSQTLLKLAKF